jgi:uncharacterized protein
MRSLIAAFAGLLLLAGPAAADAPPAGSVWTEATFPSQDGTRLHADVFRPAAPAGRPVRLPVMLVVTPYLSPPETDGGPPVLRWYRTLYERAIARGYAVAQVSLRGSGKSAGCGDFGGPREQSDVAAAIEWAAGQPWSTGAVGMAGHSYDGYAAMVGLAQRAAALRAVVVMGPAVDLYRGVFMNGVGYVQSPATASYYQGLSLLNPAAGRDPACAAAVVGPSRDRDHATAFWRARDVSARAAGATVPTFWAHGFLDGRDDFSAVRPDNFLDVWSKLEGPRRAWFGQFPHVVPGERNTWDEPEPVGRDDFVDQAIAWLDAHVKGDGRAAGTVLVQEGATGGWREEPTWPPASSGSAVLELAPGVYADGPGNKAEHDAGERCATGVRARCNPGSRTGRGTWTFSRPLSRALHLAGAPRLEVGVSGGSRVVALVYDVDEENRATLLTRGAALTGPAEEAKLAFDLYPQDWRIEAGHRIAVLLSGSDDFYFEPGDSGEQVEVVGGRLTLPLVPGSGRPAAGDPSRAVVERTTFGVEPGDERELRLRSAGARPSRPRLTRTCLRPGRLRVRLRGEADAVVFALGRRRVAVDRRPPFRRTIARRLLARTPARRLRAVVRRAGTRTVVTRSLPRCGLGARRRSL